MEGTDPAVAVRRGHRRSVDRARRRFVTASAVSITISSIVFAWMVTGGTWNFLRSLPFSNFYDVQVRAWLRGTWSVPSSVLSIEGIVTNGRTDMYYGPVPALLHLPVLVVTHRLDGRLTAPSLVIGFIVALAFTAGLVWRIRPLVRVEPEMSSAEAVLWAIGIAVVGLGSVLVFLASVSQVYEEAEMWGAALAIGALWALLGFLLAPSSARLWLVGGLVTLVMLTRGSVGVGPLLAVGLVTLVYLSALLATRWEGLAAISAWLRRHLAVSPEEPYGARTAGLVACLAVPIVAYVVINEIKFNTLFSIPLDHQVYSLTNAHRQAVLAANGGSLFGSKFAPTNLWAFLRPDGIAVVRLFPWIFFPSPAPVLGHLLYDTRDFTASIPASMPLLFALSVVGLVVVFWPTASSDSRSTPSSSPAVLRTLLLGAAVSTVGILVIAFIAERYVADAMPLLVLSAILGAHVVLRWLRGRSGTVRAVLAVILSVLAAFEMATMLSLTYFYQREVGPAITIADRASTVALQQRIDHALVGDSPPNVTFTSRLPKVGAPLDLAVIGDCASVWQSDGTSWQPVELGTAGGALRLRVRFGQRGLGRRQPLVVTGGRSPQDVVAVTWVGSDRYRFSYRFAGTGFTPTAGAWYTEAPVAIAPGAPHLVGVDLVPGVGQVTVNVDGTTVFSLLSLVAPTTTVSLGYAPVPVGTTKVFFGTILRLPVPTPICRDLLARSGGA